MMIMLKYIRYTAWAAVAVATILTFGIVVGWIKSDGIQSAQPNDLASNVKISARFNLIDQNKRKISEKDFLGSPFMVFFGFTHCPDVCPTTLFDMTQWYQELGTEGDRIKALFVSVDPERDTPELLSDYISSFDPRIMAATGTKEQIASALESFNATFEMVRQKDGSYSINHTATVFLFDSKGRFVNTVDYHEERKFAVAKLRRIATQ